MKRLRAIWLQDSGRRGAALAVSLVLHAAVFVVAQQVMSQAGFGRFTREAPPAVVPPTLVLDIVPPPAEPEPTPIVARPAELAPVVAVPVPEPIPVSPLPKPPEPEPVREPDPGPTPETVAMPPAPAPIPEPVPQMPLPSAPANPAPASSPSQTITLTAPAPATALPAGPAGPPGVYVEPRYRTTPAPPYPAAAKRRNAEGQVLLDVRIDERGRVQGVSIRESSGHATLDEAAVAAVGRWRFHPARLNDTPIPSSALVPVAFSISK